MFQNQIYISSSIFCPFPTQCCSSMAYGVATSSAAMHYYSAGIEQAEENPAATSGIGDNSNPVHLTP